MQAVQSFRCLGKPKVYTQVLNRISTISFSGLLEFLSRRGNLSVAKLPSFCPFSTLEGQPGSCVYTLGKETTRGGMYVITFPISVNINIVQKEIDSF